MKAIGENKRCCCCKEWKHVSEFPVDKHKSDGLQTLCKPCSRERARRYYANNSEKVREFSRQYRTRNAEKVRTYARQYITNNLEKRREANRLYRERNREKLLEKRRLAYASNREKIIEAEAIRSIKRNVKYKLMEEILASQGITL